jgi:hypothetical protein
MISGQVTLQGFAYAYGEGEHQKIVDGKLAGEKSPVKILSMTDANTRLSIQFIFSEDEFAEFLRIVQGGKILSAARVPLIHHPFGNGT